MILIPILTGELASSGLDHRPSTLGAGVFAASGNRKKEKEAP
jgi:hypothetical protein